MGVTERYVIPAAMQHKSTLKLARLMYEQGYGVGNRNRGEKYSDFLADRTHGYATVLSCM